MPVRLRAALLHLCLSALFALLAALIAFRLWYPPPLAQAVDLQHIFLILLGVDVVLGPCFTFLVYRVGKKSLRMDLAVIVAVQLAAFAYGFAAVAQGRPAWLVFNMDRFDLVPAQDVDTRHRDAAAPAFRHAPWTGPRWAASRNPADAQARNTLMFESAQGGPDLPQRIDLFVPLEDEAAALRARARPLDDLRQFNPAPAVAAALARWPGADGWLPLAARARSMVVLVRRADAQVLGVVDLRPWAGDD
ncbi:TfpX/TfpZ family type IV pilin accessory protein [Xylophilus sp.]|uniref:TfpX/TfpZ family type IV pilin accessory protein n=1 Tax=Xylophilus sp. TaxID=2653893 RepID=UPI0013B873FE|nr:TfpX/TfpZ family type IV pilin accessory protein [Xylophilus sp.]KAF1045515.1 MAG: hypothetical protein GAK38_02964 [Xylophilus sp.]